MKIKIYHFYNCLLATLLAFLGYGCSLSEDNDDNGTICEYGVPTTTYQLKGKIADEKGKPILGIKVKRQYYDGEGNEQIVSNADSITSDSQGSFSFTYQEYGFPADCRLIITDIDGKENGGEFASDTLNISKLVKKKIKEGKGYWDQGTYEINADIKLKEKENTK